MKPLFLVGYMGCGKSTLGRKLARRLGVDFIDTDGHTVYLRRSPEQIARRLSPYGRRKRPRLQGLDDEQLVAFMRGDMAAREPFYAQASLVVDCDPMSDDELVEHIVQTFSDRG